MGPHPAAQLRLKADSTDTLQTPSLPDRLLLMFLLILIASFPTLQFKQSSTAAPCGIELSRPSLNLLHDVEKRLGKSVHCETHMELDALGSSHVTSDGTPEVVLDTYEGKTEENLVHELFHLLLRAKGFPQHFQVKSPPHANKELFQQLAEQLGSLIEHRLFYPQMRRMGLDPTREYRKELEISMSQDMLFSVQPLEKRIVDYAEISLLVGDPDLTRRVEKWYSNRGWTAQLSRGNKLAHYLATFNPDTPGKKRTAVDTGLEIVFGRKLEVIWLP